MKLGINYGYRLRTGSLLVIPAIALLICCSARDSQVIPEDAVSSTEAAIKVVDPVRIDHRVSQEMKRLNVPGISLAIVHRGSILYEKCHGLADVEQSIPVTSESPFKIASLTKPISAIAVLQLVEKGRLSFDEKITRYIDDLPRQWGAVTVRQLLNHTSGLPDYLKAADWSWKDSWRLDRTHDEVISMCEKSPMAFNPGERMQYCNTGYYLLGMLIERVSGVTYSDYLRDNIFEPLGMTHSRVDRSKSIVPNRVSGYTMENGKLCNAEFTSDTWAYAEGGVITTARDLARLDSALYTEGLIGRSSISLMWTPGKLSNGDVGVIGDNGAGKPNHYGMGWYISDYKDRKLILAGGNKPGFTCIFFRFADHDLSVIILSNISSAPLYGMAGEIGEMYLDD